MIPVVVGPDKRNYVIDHLLIIWRARHEEGEKEVLVSVVADLTIWWTRRRSGGGARQPSLECILRRQG